MKTGKKLLSVLMVVLMLLSLSAAAFAEGVEDDAVRVYAVCVDEEGHKLPGTKTWEPKLKEGKNGVSNFKPPKKSGYLPVDFYEIQSLIKSVDEDGCIRYFLVDPDGAQELLTADYTVKICYAAVDTASPTVRYVDTQGNTVKDSAKLGGMIGDGDSLSSAGLPDVAGTCGTDSLQVNGQKVDAVVREDTQNYQGKTIRSNYSMVVGGERLPMNSGDEVEIVCTTHEWGAYEQTKAPTCTEKGEEVRSCSVCGETESREIEALGHAWDEGEVTKEPSCTEKGEKTFRCENCEATKTEEVEALGHEWDEGEVTTEPTCTEKGEKTFHCKNCEATKTEEVEALGHEWDEGEVTKEPTCTEKGEKTFRCKNCEATKTEEVEALGHEWDEGEVTKEPTCTEKGEKTFHCKNCEATKTEEIPVKDHEWELSKDTATCTEKGEKTYTCKNCGATKTEASEAKGHKWDGGKVTKTATCEEKGVKTYSCENCGETKTEELPALGHKWDAGKVTKKPSCTKTGEKTFTCSRCASKRIEVIKAKGHTYSGGLCKVCGARQPGFKPELIEGNGKTAYHGTKFRAVSNAAFKDFKYLLVDGDEVPWNRYYVSEGSTVVEISGDYISKLATGSHTISVVSGSGIADGFFYVSDKVKTGDEADLGLWIALMGMSGLFAIATFFTARRRPKA